MAFYLAKNLGYVNKLTSTWKLVGNPKGLQVLELMNPIHNFRQYRELFNKSAGAPALPCQEVFLKDLLLTSESGQNFVSGSIIDTGKLDSLGAIMESVRVAQSKLYPFVQKPELLLNLVSIEEFDRDRDRERFESQAKQIIQLEEGVKHS